MVVSLLNRPSKFSIVDVVVLFAGKVISLDSSNTVVFNGVCARSSLSRTLLLSLDRQLQGYKATRFIPISQYGYEILVILQSLK